MESVTIDNSIFADLCRTITWQYDNATNLIGIIMAYYKNDTEQPGLIKGFFDESTNQFWNNWRLNTLDIDNANDYGLSVWGKLLSCPRPTIKADPTHQVYSQQTLPTELYRKLLKCRFNLLNSNASDEAYRHYIEDMFDGNVTIHDGRDMSITFEIGDGLDNILAAFVSQYPDIAFIYPAGVQDNKRMSGLIFGFDGQQPVDENDPAIGGFDNSTFDWTGKFKDIRDAYIISQPIDMIYTGYAQEPSVTVYWKNNQQLVRGKDFILTYYHNVELGKACVLVTGIGGYTGTVVKYFTIKKAPV